MTISNSLDQLELQSYKVSTEDSTKYGLVGLNPDGSSISGGSAPLTFNMTSLDQIKISGYVESIDVPGQVGVILLNPDGSNIG